MSVKKIITYNPVNSSGEKLNTTHELTLKILENSGNYLIHKDILRHHISIKQGTVSTKTRSEVRGGGRKPWKQKGTGRARAGSNRSPLWKGGGVIFGPKPKTNKHKLNKKEYRLAIQTLFYNKKNNILLIENLEKNFETPKTQKFYKICQNCGINLDERTLIIVSKEFSALRLSVQNIKNIELISASQLNTLSLIKAKQIILTSSALSKLKENFNE
uniref:ribosomal protein L4 n=1 Tax=Thalassionema bacillare TaxID=426664 RepID=UPI001EE0D32B|nr:ribosomal protein L4 [Thalassionema bacillare]UHY40453.1 ribosomal protein L4 [Thalassionema bacillare]UHY40840.1 ribosomal protein L4 [Thalassionema bacillare]UHY41098.1 ribosomal protein L4 [Thalassionema bacillare]